MKILQGANEVCCVWYIISVFLENCQIFCPYYFGGNSGNRELFSKVSGVVTRLVFSMATDNVIKEIQFVFLPNKIKIKYHTNKSRVYAIIHSFNQSIFIIWWYYF